MPLNEPFGDYVPREDELPPRRRPVLTKFSILFFGLYELGMLLYFLVEPARRRPSDFIGIWVLGSLVSLSLLGFALGETTADMAELGSRWGRFMGGLARRRKM